MNELLPDFPLSVFGIWVNGAMWQTALCHASGKTPLPAAAVTPPNFLPTRNRIDLQAKKGIACPGQGADGRTGGRRVNAGRTKKYGGIRFATAASLKGNMVWIEAQAAGRENRILDWRFRLHEGVSPYSSASDCITTA